jgi:hypothetical protein
MDLESTEDVARLHYLPEESASWTSEEYSTVSSSSQSLHLPAAPSGGTARVRTVPVSVSPESGELEVLVEDAETDRFRVRTGDSAGASSATVTYYDTVPGSKYALYSHTLERNADVDTAESPVEFAIDGSEQSYSIKLYEGGGGGAAVALSGAGGGGGSGPLTIVALFAGLAGSILGTVFVGRRFLGVDGARGNLLLLVVGGVVGFVGVELVTPRSIVSDLVFVSGGALGEFLGGFASSGIGAVVISLVILGTLYGVDRRTGWIPTWLFIAAGIGTGVYSLESLTGALSSGLEQVSPLLWLALVGGGLLLVWRALQPTIVRIGGSDR